MVISAIIQAMIQPIKAIIWDLDDTLYSDNGSLVIPRRHAVAQAVLELGYDITYDEAYALAEASQKQYRTCYTLLAQKFDIPQKDLHYPFHDALDHLITIPHDNLPLAFEQYPHVKHAIVTHSTRDWALRMRDHMGLTAFFSDPHVFGLEDLDFNYKHESDRAIQTALDILGTDPSETAFIEDRIENLLLPHQKGLTTVLIRHSSHPADIPGHVHHYLDHPVDVFKTILL